MRPGQQLSQPLRRPTISDQESNLLRLEELIRTWSDR